MTFQSRIDTKRIESSAWTFDDHCDGHDFSRLAALSESQQVKVVLDISVTREARHEFSVSGKVDLTIDLICQRCLDVYAEQIKLTVGEIFAVPQPYKQMAQTSAIKEKDSQAEPNDYFDDENFFCLQQYIEDELLLAIPNFPAHAEEKDCNPVMLERLNEKTEVVVEKENPFSVLNKLN